MSDKRIKLEQSATESVQRIGLNNLSFRHLAEDNGIKSSSVHYYFPEKGNLANAIIENYTRQFADNLDQITEKHTHPKKKLIEFVKIFEQVVEDDKLCLCGMMAAEVNNLQQDARELLDHFFIQAEDWLCDIFESNKNQLTIDVKPRQLARLVLSGLEGAILLDRVGKQTHRLRAQRAFISKLIV